MTLSIGQTLPHEGIAYPVFDSEKVAWHTWSIKEAAKTDSDSFLRVVRIAPNTPFDSLYALTRAARTEFRRVANYIGATVIPYKLGFASIPPAELSALERRVVTHEILPSEMALVADVTLVADAKHRLPESLEAQQMVLGVERYIRDAIHTGSSRWLDTHDNSLSDPRLAILSQVTIGTVMGEEGAYFTDIDHYIE